MTNRSCALTLGLLLALAGCTQVEGVSPSRTYSVQVINEWSPMLWSLYENSLLTMVNEERAKQGLKPLTRVAKLDAVAKAHSRDMATRRYATHVSPDGKGPADRLKAAGITFSLQGENLHRFAERSNLMRAFMVEPDTGWMSRPGPRANILSAKFTQLGVGVWEATNGYTYATLTFIRP